MHTGLVSGWAGAMTFFEVGAFDPYDITFNPMWRQGIYVIPSMKRLGVVDSWSGWSMLGESASGSSAVLWSYEAVGASHIILAGLLFAASIWHWTSWLLRILDRWYLDGPFYRESIWSQRYHSMVYNHFLGSIFCVVTGAPSELLWLDKNNHK